MITIDTAKIIAQNEFPDFPIYSIIDVGDEWAFDYDTPIPGIPFICVSKSNGSVRRLSVPPLENLDIIENGELIYSAE